MIIGVITLWLICGFIGALIGQSRGRAGIGFFLGLLLGPLGWILLLFESGPKIALCLIFGEFIVGGLIVAGVATYVGFQSFHRNQEAQTESGAPEVASAADTWYSSPSTSQQTSEPESAPAAAEASPAPASPQSPSAEEVAAREARANARQALEIARKYGGH